MLFRSFEEEHTSVKIANLPEWPQRQLLTLEREMLGLYISDHPLRGAESRIRTAATESIASFNSRARFEDSEAVTLAGLITAVEVKTARSSGNIYANVTLEDLDSETTMMIFSKTYQQFEEILKVDSIVAIRGRMRPRDDGFTLNVNEVVVLEKETSILKGPLNLVLPEQLTTRSNIELLDKLLAKYPGQTEVVLLLRSEKGLQEYKIRHRVYVSEALISEIKQHFGTSVLESNSFSNSVQTLAGDDVASLVVEQAGELFS